MEHPEPHDFFIRSANASSLLSALETQTVLFLLPDFALASASWNSRAIDLKL